MPVQSPSVRTIFESALDLPATERTAFLDEACTGNAELRAQVDALLSAHRDAGSFLEQPALNPDVTAFHESPITERPGTIIGPYKLLQQIGEGGMGVVFMAEQTKPIQRTVALKIIKPGMDTRQVVARFEAERQALAMMDHPNIARVIDAGTTEGGRSYFVMDLVKGVPITAYCDEHQMTVRERLELFKPVCDAIQHAHQKGIIHRDLKPTNVLVAQYDGKPVPKIIDFGVAKATAQKLTERTMFTEFGQVIGTVEYMSPEQATFNQLDVDTRSDIYSLGVLLYELLTGSTPFERKRLRDAAFDEMLRIIREEEPPKPSTWLDASDTLPSVAASRQTEPARLSQDISGELDWIVMRALEKDRQRRYQTANALADDLEHYLTDQPVAAGPPSPSYRLKKFIRRNKLGVLAGSAIAATLVLGFALASWLYLRERTSRQRADTEASKRQQVAQFLKDTLDAAGPSVARGRDATMLREILESTAQRVDHELADQAEVQAEMQYTIAKVYLDLDDRIKAEQMFRRALATRQKLFGDTNQEVAETLSGLGDSLQRRNEYPHAEQTHREALAILRQLHPEDHPDVAQGLIRLGLDIGRQKQAERYDEALEYLRQGLNTLRVKFGSDSEEVASALQVTSVVLQEQVALPGVKDGPGKLAEIERMRRESVAISRKIYSGDHPNLAIRLNDWGFALKNIGKNADAVTIQQEALAMEKKVFGPEHALVANSLNYLGDALKSDGKPAEAEAAYRESVAIITKLGIDIWWARSAFKNLVDLLKDRGDLAEAAEFERQSWILRQKRLGKDHPDTTLALKRLINLLQQQGKQDEADALRREVGEQSSADKPNEKTKNQ